MRSVMPPGSPVPAVPPVPPVPAVSSLARALVMALALAFVLIVPYPGGAGRALAAGEEDGWVYMPAGARPTYFGIHGGTMPVSLLVSDDGAALVSIVGRTGNDFLDILYGMDRRIPSLFNGTSPESRPVFEAGGPAVPSGLTAGGGGGSLPVFHFTGGRASHLLPFGFSDTPLPIEGRVMLPSHTSPAKSFRLHINPKYLRPR